LSWQNTYEMEWFSVLNHRWSRFYRNRPFNLIQNKVGYRSCFATGVKLEQFLWNKNKIIKSKGTTENRKFRCVYMSNELISKIIWRFATGVKLDSFHETVLTLNKFWRWFTADLIVHWVRRVFFLTLSGISCVTILKYTLILSPHLYWKLTLNTHFLLDFIYFHETIDFSLTSVTSSHVEQFLWNSFDVK
jgi:hypothetical protein